jgi:hypothetical protein
MAKLPSGPDFGEMPGAASGRPVADSGDVGSYMRRADATTEAAGNAFGDALQLAGRRVGVAANEMQQKDDVLEYTKAKAHFVSNRIKRDSDILEDNDNATLEQRYANDIDGLRTASLNMVRNPNLRGKLEAELADDVARGLANVKGTVFKRTADGEIASTTDFLNTTKEAALRSTDPKERAMLVDAVNDRLAGLRVKNYITQESEVKMRQAWSEGYGTDWLKAQPPEERARLSQLPPRTIDEVVDRVIGPNVEGTGQNPRSSAFGTGQFIKETWLATLYKHGPDELKAKIEPAGDGKFRVKNAADAEQLYAMRADPTLGRAMTKALMTDNAAALRDAGLQPTPGNLYLAHFLGAGGATKVLKANPNTPVADLVGEKAVEANPSVLSGKTAGTVAAWATGKMGGAQDGVTGTPADFVPFSTRVALGKQAEQEISANKAQVSLQTGEEIESRLRDAAAGLGAMPSRDEIEQNPNLLPSTRNALKGMYDKANEEVLALAKVQQKFADPNAGSFNPYDKDDRDNIDKIYSAMSKTIGPVPAVMAVTERAKVMPKSAATAMRGELASNDPARVASSMTLAHTLLKKNANIFAGVEGGKELEENAVTFEHYVNFRGMKASDAASRMIREQTPEYKASIALKVKNEDVPKIIKDNLTPTDLMSAFNEGIPIFSRPVLENNPEQRAAAMLDYGEIFKDEYLASGDISLAKSRALKTMGKVWGVSNVTGSDTIMRYPPEKSRAWSDIPGASTLIADQALKFVQNGYALGEDAMGYAKGKAGKVERSSIILIPTSDTANAYKAGASDIPYMMSWRDGNGDQQFAVMPFVPKPDEAKKIVSAKRQADLAAEGADYDARVARARDNNAKNVVLQGARERIAADRRAVTGEDDVAGY